MSELSLQDTGVDLQRLKGQDNYVRWSRDFKVIAEVKGVWKVVTEEEPILTKPLREDYFQSFKAEKKTVTEKTASRKSTRLMDKTEDGNTTEAEETKNFTSADFSARISEYKLDLEEYEKNNKRVRIANALIAYWIDPAIRGKVQSLEDPKQAWDWIVSQYKMQDAWALDIALAWMEKLKLTACSSVQDFLNQHEMCKLNIEDVKGEYSNAQMVSKIIWGLSPQYNPFMDQYHFLQDTAGLTNPDLKALTSQLLTFESKLHERLSNKTVNALSKKDDSFIKKDDDHSERKKWDKCMTPGCGKWGHSSENCWIAHPEKKNQDEGKKDQREDKLKQDGERKTKKPSVVTAMATINLAKFKDLLLQSAAFKATSLTILKQLSIMSTFPDPLREVTQADLNPQALSSKPEGDQLETSEGWMEKGNDENLEPEDTDISMSCTQSLQNNHTIFNNTMMLLENGDNVQSDTWILDSEANVHIVNDERWFTEIMPVTYTVSTADNTGTLEIHGGGEVSLSLIGQDNSLIELILTTVTYAPGTWCNVLSLSMLAENAGLQGRWNGEKMTICTRDGHNIGIATLTDELYHLELKRSFLTDVSSETEIGFKTLKGIGVSIEVQPPQVTAIMDFSDSVWMWHQRMRHLGIDNLRRLLKMSDGMNITEKQIKAKIGAVCPICAMTKVLVKILRDSVTRRYHEPGELIHVDTWGSYPVAEWDKTKFFLMATDDATRYTWCERFNHKNEIPEALHNLHKRLEKTHNFTIRRYRVNNELIWNTKLLKWYEKHSITVKPITPYAHHQNEVAERAHQTEREKAATMLQENNLSSQLSCIIRERGEEMLQNSNISEKLWPEAFSHAVWLKNRSLTKALKNKKTSWEGLESRKPDLSRERVWGSRAYVTQPHEIRTSMRDSKLITPRGWLGYFVGCESESVYCIWSPEKNKVLWISAARIDDGEGLDDNHEDPSLNQRITQEPRQSESSSELSELLSSESENSEHDKRSENKPRSGSQLFLSSDEEDALFNEEPEEDENDFSNKKVILAAKRIRSETSDDDSEDNTSHVWPSRIRRNPRTIQDASEKCHFCFHNEYRCDQVRPKCSACVQKNRICRLMTAKWISQDKAERCQRCLDYEYICDEAQLTCGRCYKQGTECEPQVTALKYFPGQESKYQDWSEKCHHCLKRVRKCDKSPPHSKDDSCSSCVKLKMTCESPETRNWRKGVTDEKKCGYCHQHERACNEKFLCDTCINERHRCLRQGEKILWGDDKCRTCKNLRMACDEGNPCETCVKMKLKYCLHYDSDGHTQRFYLVDPESQLYTSNEECQQCLKSYTTMIRPNKCDKAFPCNNCKRLSSILTCTYHGQGGVKVKFLKNPALMKAHGEKQKKRKLAKINETSKEEETEQDKTLSEWETGSSNESSQEGLTEDKLNEDIDSDKDSDSVRAPEDTNDSDEDTDSVRAPENEALKHHKLLSPARWRKHSQGKGGKGVQIMSVACLAELALSPEPRNRAMALASSEAEQWKVAMQEEYNSLIENNTWTIVDRPTEQKPLSGRWVLKRKLGSDGKVARHKARFVVRGFEQVYGIDFDETYASVVKPPSYKLFFALQAWYGWKSRQIDIKTAFLNGDILEDVYIKASDGFPAPPEKVLKLNKSLYELKQSSRQWYQKLRSFLEECGWKVSTFDSSIFFNGKGLYMTIYVDDINIFEKNEEDIEKVMTELNNRFDVSDLGECSFYLGMHVTWDKAGTVYLHQANFVQQILNRFDLHDIKPVSTSEDSLKKLQSEKRSTSDAEFRTKYQAMVGSLNYLMTVSRPDIAHAVRAVARYNSNPNDEHMAAVVWIYAYLKGSMTLGLHYSSDDSNSAMELFAFVNSDWGGCSDTTRSMTGWVFILNGSLISWSSKRQQTVALSSCEAEYMAATEAAKEAVWLKGFIQELNLSGFKPDAIQLFIDNNSAMKLMKNPEFHGRTKHIAMRHHFIREKVLGGDIAPARVDSRDNLADLFTKSLPRAAFERLVENLGMTRKMDAT